MQLSKRICPRGRTSWSSINAPTLSGCSGREEINESTNQIAIDVARQKGVVVSPSDIDRSHRIGKSGGKSHRPIIVQFVSYDKRNEVFKAKKILRKTGIVIQEDLTKIRADTVFSKKLLI